MKEWERADTDSEGELETRFWGLGFDCGDDVADDAVAVDEKYGYGTGIDHNSDDDNIKCGDGTGVDHNNDGDSIDHNGGDEYAGHCIHKKTKMILLMMILWMMMRMPMMMMVITMMTTMSPNSVMIVMMAITNDIGDNDGYDGYGNNGGNDGDDDNDDDGDDENKTAKTMIAIGDESNVAGVIENANTNACNVHGHYNEDDDADNSDDLQSLSYNHNVVLPPPGPTQKLAPFRKKIKVIYFNRLD